MESVAPRVKILLAVMVLGLLSTFYFGSIGVLLLLGGTLGAFGLLLEWCKYLQRKKAYERGLGVVLDDQGVTFYGDNGPAWLPWSSFGEVHVFPFERSVLQHIPIDHLHWTGRARAEATCSTPIDYLDMTPEGVLQVLASHPSFQGKAFTPRSEPNPG